MERAMILHRDGPLVFDEILWQNKRAETTDFPVNLDTIKPLDDMAKNTSVKHWNSQTARFMVQMERLLY